MKRRDLISQLEQFGCYLIRHRGKHDIYHNPNIVNNIFTNLCRAIVLDVV